MVREIKVDILDELRIAYANYIKEETKWKNLSEVRGRNPGKFKEFKIIINGLMDEIKIIRNNRLELEKLISKLDQKKQKFYLGILNTLKEIENKLNRDLVKIESNS